MNEHQTLSDIEKKGKHFLFYRKACYSCSLWKNKCLFTHHTFCIHKYPDENMFPENKIRHFYYLKLSLF